MKAAVVFGGYGTFGSLVARELARLGLPVVVAGRDRARAEAFARELGPRHRGVAADVSRLDSCRTVLHDQAVAVNCAGPFAWFSTPLLEACLHEGCHYADIGDDRGYLRLVRRHDAAFRQRGLLAVPGCSSLPAISGALGVLARRDAVGPPRQARVTLFIGNRHPKGLAAVQSAVRTIGQPIAAPQGMVRGFLHRAVVTLPAPIGRRTVFAFEGPEYDLFPPLLGVRSVTVHVGFELRLVMLGFALLGLVPTTYGAITALGLYQLGRPLQHLGTPGSAVQTELFFPDGSWHRAALLARHDGQRMAALPCAFVAQQLRQETTPDGGVRMPYEYLGAQDLLEKLVAAGYELHCTRKPSPSCALQGIIPRFSRLFHRAGHVSPERSVVESALLAV